MGAVVNAGKGVEVEVRVALRGGNAAVAEQLLHGAKVRPAFQKVGGKGVAQIVRRNVLGNAGLLRPFLQNAGGLPPLKYDPSFV